MILYLSKTARLRRSLFWLAAFLALTGNAWAEDFGREHHEDAREHREFGRDRRDFHERDVHRFNEEDFGRWRGGQWRNSCFAGRCGWWWFSGGQWYFYDRPEYPYPLYVSEFAYVEPVPVVPAAPPPVYVVPPPTPAVPPPPTPQVYYYCDNPPGYYPYVPSCSTQFRPVPAPPR